MDYGLWTIDNGQWTMDKWTMDNEAKRKTVRALRSLRALRREAGKQLNK
jgi:hypothetical protein